jgi:hypothetical protein
MSTFYRKLVGVIAATDNIGQALERLRWKQREGWCNFDDEDLRSVEMLDEIRKSSLKNADSAAALQSKLMEVWKWPQS